MKRSAIKAKFKIGDKVYKPSGYVFGGFVRAAFIIGNGEWRYVVEHNLSVGLLHIFNGSQLEKN